MKQHKGVVHSPDQIAEMGRSRRLSACVGKEAFDSRGVANAVALRRRRKGMRSAVYKCKGCGKYHIGRPKQKDRKGSNDGR